MEIQSLVSHFDQFHAIANINENHENHFQQKTESEARRKCPHCSQLFSKLNTKHIKKM